MSFVETIRNWQGNDEDLLKVLNQPNSANKRLVNGGLVSLPMVAAVSEELAGALVITMKRTIGGLKATYESMPEGTARDQYEGQYEIFSSFLKRLTESSYGAPIDSDSFRGQFANVALSAGWTAEQTEAFLSLGAVVPSDSEVYLGRLAEQADIDSVRREQASEVLMAEYDAQYNLQISAALAEGDRSSLVAGLRAMASALEGN